LIFTVCVSANFHRVVSVPFRKAKMNVECLDAWI
jgi:hypothetical protein